MIHFSNERVHLGGSVLCCFLFVFVFVFVLFCFVFCFFFFLCFSCFVSSFCFVNNYELLCWQTAAAIRAFMDAVTILHQVIDVYVTLDTTGTIVEMVGWRSWTDRYTGKYFAILNILKVHSKISIRKFQR